MKIKHIKHLLLFINNTVMTQDNGRIYNIHVHCERRKEKGTMKRKHIKHLLLFINNTVMTQENGRVYNIHVHCERRKEQ